MSEDLQVQEKKGNGAFIAIIIILLLVLAGMAYLWSSKNSELNTCNNERKKVELENKEMNALLSEHLGEMSDNLLRDMDVMLKDYEDLKLNGTAEQRAEIEAQQEMIRDLQDKVKRGERTASALYAARKENEELRRIMRGYVYEIDSLNTLNLRLRNDLDETSTALQETTSERDEYKDQAEKYGEKVKEGQKLNAYGFETVGLRQKLNNDMTPTSKAKNTVQIRSSFTIGKNALTDPGNKTVYMQVIGPDNKTLQSSAGNIVQTETGSVPFSDKKSIDYNNQSIDVSVYYSVRNEELSKGNYKVKIYCQGQLIGQDSFSLK